MRDDIGGEVQHPLQVARRDVEQQAQPAGRALDEPDVRNGRSKLDVAHSIAPDLRSRHFDAAFIANHAFIAYTLVFSTITLPILLWAKYFLTEKTIALWLERSIVDRLWFSHFAVRPA